MLIFFPDFSFTSWMQTHGAAVVADATDLLYDTMYEELKISQYLQKECSPGITIPAESKYLSFLTFFSILVKVIYLDLL